MMFDLLIKSSENFGRESGARNISRSSSLEIKPSIVSDMKPIDDFESDMIYHEDVSEDNTDDRPDREKYDCPSNNSELIYEQNRKKEKEQIHNHLTKIFFAKEKFIRLNEEIKVNKDWSHPKKNLFVSMKNGVFANSPRKNLIIISDVSIMDI